LNVDAILINHAYCASSPQPSRHATCQPIIATAGAGCSGIGYRWPEPDTLRKINHATQKWDKREQRSSARPLPQLLAVAGVDTVRNPR